MLRPETKVKESLDPEPGSGRVRSDMEVGLIFSR